MIAVVEDSVEGPNRIVALVVRQNPQHVRLLGVRCSDCRQETRQSKAARGYQSSHDFFHLAKSRVQ